MNNEQQSQQELNNEMELGQGASIEVDLTNEDVATDKVEDSAPEQQQGVVQNNEENVEEEVEEQQGEQQHQDEVKDTDDNTNDDKSNEVEKESEVDNDESTKDEPVEESEEEEKENNNDKDEQLEEPHEPTEKELELMAQVEAYKEAEDIRTLAGMRAQAEQELGQITTNVQEALVQTVKKYNIPEDKTLDELRAEAPEKAAILEGLLTNAQEVINMESSRLSAVVEEKAKEVLFNKAGKMFDKYKLTPEQADIAADTFITIMNQVGFNDLGEDLSAKVKLCVAQAKMDAPEVAVVEEQVKEEPKEPEKKEEESKTEEGVKPQEQKQEPQEEKKETPDLSEFMEGVEGSVTKATETNVDNVLEKLSALPFKERTKFYKEHQDLINEAMKKTRG